MFQSGASKLRRRYQQLTAAMPGPSIGSYLSVMTCVSLPFVSSSHYSVKCRRAQNWVYGLTSLFPSHIIFRGPESPHIEGHELLERTEWNITKLARHILQRLHSLQIIPNIHPSVYWQITSDKFNIQFVFDRACGTLLCPQASKLTWNSPKYDQASARNWCLEKLHPPNTVPMELCAWRVIRYPVERHLPAEDRKVYWTKS